MAREFASAHALALIVALAAVVRFTTLGVPAYWLDEWTMVTETDGGFGDIIDAVRDVEGGPPLYLVVLWAWQKVFGGSEIAIRSLSALLGTAAVPVAYAAARELASRRAGLFAAALTATSPYLIWYSQEVRAYSLFAFLSALSLLFFVYALRREEPRWLWGWAIASGLALATHYFALALIVPEAIWLLLRARAPRVKAVLACAGVGAVGLALIPLVVEQRDRVADFIGTLDLSDRLLAVPQHLLVGLSVPWRVVPVLVGCALVAAVSYALFRADQPSRRAFALMGGIGLAGILITVVPAFLGNDYILPRYMVELWLPFAVAVAVALAVLAVGRVGTAVVVALCVIGVALSTWNAASPEARRLNWDEVARALGEPDQERVVVGPGYFVGVGTLPLSGRRAPREGGGESRHLGAGSPFAAPGTGLRDRPLLLGRRLRGCRIGRLGAAIQGAPAVQARRSGLDPPGHLPDLSRVQSPSDCRLPSPAKSSSCRSPARADRGGQALRRYR